MIQILAMKPETVTQALLTKEEQEAFERLLEKFGHADAVNLSKSDQQATNMVSAVCKVQELISNTPAGMSGLQ